MNQVTYLKSLGFTWKKIADLLGVSKVFDPHIFAIVRFVVDSVVKFLSVVVEADDSAALTL